MNRLLLLNGPNLNKLGSREKTVYGATTLQQIETDLQVFVSQFQFTLDSFQSNHEGELIDQLHEADGKYQGIIFNPGAYTHTSIALHDAIKAIQTPVIEVHISNVYQRESFRHVSMTAPASQGQIVGFGKHSYHLAAFALIHDYHQ